MMKQPEPKVCDLNDPECTCPCAWTEASEQAQNYGCLPEPWDIRNMRVLHGKTWACHGDHSQPCIGGIRFLKERGEPYKVIDPKLITLDDDWENYIRPVDNHVG